MQQSELSENEIAVFGSGPLVAGNIIPVASDRDAIYRRTACQKVREIESLQFSDDYHVEIIMLFDRQVTFGNNSTSSDFDVKNFVDDSELTNGCRS